jgi:hypothetical protein
MSTQAAGAGVASGSASSGTTTAPAAGTGTPAASGEGTGAQGKAAEGGEQKKGEEAAKPKASFLGDTKDPEKKAEGDKGKQGDKAKAGDKSTDAKLEFKLPDGVKLDVAVADEYRAAFKELGVTDAEQASKIVALDVKRQQQWSDQQTKQWEEQGDKWAAELAADKDFGGEKIEATVINAKRFLRAYGGEEAAKAFRDLGIGNHPVLVKMLARAGAGLREDTTKIDDKSAGGGGDKRLTQEERLGRMYDHKKASA